MAKSAAKIFWEVNCVHHGIKQSGMPENFRPVKVTTPTNKRERFTQGCPKCKGERNAS